MALRTQMHHHAEEAAVVAADAPRVALPAVPQVAVRVARQVVQQAAAAMDAQAGARAPVLVAATGVTGVVILTVVAHAVMRAVHVEVAQTAAVAVMAMAMAMAAVEVVEVVAPNSHNVCHVRT